MRGLTLADPALGGTVGGATGAIVSDSFNRSDSAVSLGNADTGQAWSAVAGTWGIAANRAYVEVVAPAAIAVVDAGVQPPLVSVTYAVLAAVADGGAGVISKYSDIDNYYLVWVPVPASGGCDLYKFVGGAATLLGHDATAIVAGDVFGLGVVGSAVTVLVNGVSRIAVTDSDVPAGTKCGLRTGESGVSVARWDDFTVTV